MKFLSLDPSLTNTGWASGLIDDGQVIVREIGLIESPKGKSKQVRASSDTIARCRNTWQQVQELIDHFDPNVIFAETPTGSQSANGMKSYGATCQLLACLPVIPIEVTAEQVKIAATGKKTASKADVIDWAFDLYPDMDWFFHAGKLQGKNEHMADAIAAAYAGVKTSQFRQLASMFASV